MTSNGRRRLGTDFREMIVVVVSILIAFGLQASWEEYVERSEERDILENLLAEFRAAVGELDYRLDAHDRTLRGLELAWSTLSEARAEGLPSVSVPDTAMMLAMLPSTYDPRTGTLDGLLSGGRLGLISDPELRIALSGWPGLLEEASEDEYLGRDIVYEQLLPTLGQYVDTSPFEMGLMKLLGPGLPPEQLAASSMIPTHTDVISLLGTRVATVFHARDQLLPVREEVSRIIDLTEASLVR